ncbi:MAG: GNAT family N-acetyltransferase [Candidatus Eremiobacteraeota bacterium]|nr:GNAT family N-acetyltransferase [Candidatus Eremiobacteraeota bacterium]
MTGRTVPEIAEIETARLRLRRHRRDDFAACAGMWADPAVVRYIGGQPSTEQQVWSRLLNYAGHWQLMGFGYWVVELKATGLYIGELGFADFKRDIVPSIAGMPELGWALVPDAHGKGYATEALRAVVAWGDERFGRARTVCLIDAENVASIRVAEKCGYGEVERTTYLGRATLIFAR